MAHETGFRLHNIGGSGTLVGLDMADQAQKTDPSGELGYTPFDAADVDTDPTLAANSDLLVPSQKAIKEYVDTELASNPSKLFFYETLETVSSSAGLGISANCVYFGSILIPAGTVQAGDNIEVETMQLANGASTGGAGWALRDLDFAPLAAQLTPNTADANGAKSFIACVNQTGVYHCGMRHRFKATQPGLYIAGSSTAAGNVLASNCIINHFDYQSLNLTPYTDSVVDWANTAYRIVFFHRAAAATTMTHIHSSVKIYRP